MSPRGARTYRSPTRARQARATRRAIIDAARERFVTDGYPTTTMQAIARDAGVSVQTVYAIFQTKRQLLSDVLDVAIAGDDEPIAVNEREWMQRALHDPDPGARIDAYAAAVTRILAGAGDVFTVVRDAAAVDAELAELAATADANRRKGATAVVRGLDRIGGLREGLDRKTAVDVLWTLNSPDVFQLLVRRSGWSLPRYERWLASVMRQQLLAVSAGS